MNHAYYLKRIWFTGPGIEESVVDFIDGLNIIYGANDTGKSWILDAFDYMCGSGHDSFVIDDDTGCNQVHLEVVTSQGTVIMHRMLHSTKIEVESTDPRIESHQYTEGKSNYPINRVWMTILGIGSGVKVIKNENADRQSITIRSIINLLCVPLERMNRRESIFHTEGSYYSRTVTKSTLLYFLTEDLYLEYKAHKSDAKLRQEQKVRNEIKNDNLEFLSNLRAEIQFDQDLASPDEINKKIDQLMYELSSTQSKLSEATDQRKRLAEEIVKGNDRLKEAQLLKQRYGILRDQYRSELKRISFVVDGDQKLHKIQEPENCPFCGAKMPESAIESYEDAARIESERILPQLIDLDDAEKSVDNDISDYKGRIQAVQQEADHLQAYINQELTPVVRMLEEQIGELRLSIKLQSQVDVIKKVEKHIMNPVIEGDQETYESFKARDKFSSEFVNDFNELLDTILKEVHFDKYGNSYFDFDSNDFDIVVNGKRKARYGGGYKAFLNTVVAVALHHYLMEKGKHSPGVLLLDSPILSLKDETDTVSSVMRDNLFKYLVKTQEYGQIIIVENAIPKIDYGSAKLEEFTHDEKEGRYGLLIGYTE